MPKGNRSSKNTGKGTPKRGSGPRTPRRNGPGMSDEDSVNGDTASVLSTYSDRGSMEDVCENGNGEIDVDDNTSGIHTQSREILEEKIAEAIEGMTEKSASVRTASLTSLITILSQQIVPDLVMSRKETLRDNLEKIFKRGQRSDQGLSACLASLSALQIGSLDLDIATEDFGILRPMLQTIVLDHTVPAPVRVKCCQALCLGAFLAESSLDDINTMLNLLEPLFGATIKAEQETLLETTQDVTASPSRNIPKIPKSSCSNLASAAIAGWSLLITVMPIEFLAPKSNRWMRILKELLNQAELEVRLNAGEAVALLVETCKLGDDSEESELGSSGEEDSEGSDGPVNGHSDRINMRSMISKLRELSVQSHKYQAKRDRRQQRHSFRDYLHAVEDGDGPGQVIKFGNGEVLEIDSWVKKRQYDAICQVLGSGMNRHLVDNILVRDILDLGSPKPNVGDGGASAKAAKSERQYMNQVNFKARCVSRGKSRDQRMANLSEF